ncbi:MAG: hypothetical protein PVF73_11550 [Bacteroidales bacterium]|jgi:hypothetical protein
MKNQLTALFDYRVKRVALILACIAFVADMVIRQTGNEVINIYDHHILLHYGVLISLLSAVLSKDKVDDELSMKVRYGIFKNTFSFIVVMFGIVALLMSRSLVKSLSTLTIMYCLEGMMVVHLIFYYFGVRYHPKWLLSEETAPRHYNRMMITFLISFLVLVLVIIFLSVAADLEQK